MCLTPSKSRCKQHKCSKCRYTSPLVNVSVRKLLRRVIQLVDDAAFNHFDTYTLHVFFLTVSRIGEKRSEFFVCFTNVIFYLERK